MNRSLAGEVVRMALDTLRSNKMRSGLTILGVVIGITAIVGMTSLIRGFDQSLRDSVKALGPSTIILTKLSIVSIGSGAEFSDLLRRPNLTVDDAKAIEKLAPTIQTVDILLDVTNPGLWMAHCHIAEHHESGMMFRFRVDP